MWWARSRPAQACLSGTRVMWSGPDGEMGVLECQGVEAGWRAIRDLVQESTANELRVWLSGGLCRAMVAVPVGGVRDREEAQRAMTAALLRTGAARPGEAAYLTERFDGEEPVPVALIGAKVLQAMPEWSAIGVKLRVLKPWWSAAGNMLSGHASGREGAPANRLVAMYDGEWVNFFDFALDGRVREAGNSGPIASVDEAQRVVLRLGAADPNRALLCVHLGSSGPLPTTETATGRVFAFERQVVIGERF